MSKKTITLGGVAVWVSAETSLQDALFLDWRHSAPSPNTPLLGGSLADLTRSLHISGESQRCFFSCFNSDEPVAPWLAAVLTAFRFSIDQRFSVGVWSSPDPLNDGCLTLLSIKPSKLREQSSDVLAVIEAFLAEEDARYSSDLTPYLRALYRGVPQAHYTPVMRWAGAPLFSQGNLSVTYGLLLRDDGGGPSLWLWSRPMVPE
jgi:hypothetical protein